MTSRGAAWWPACGTTASTLTGEHTLGAVSAAAGPEQCSQGLLSSFLWQSHTLSDSCWTSLHHHGNLYHPWAHPQVVHSMLVSKNLTTLHRPCGREMLNKSFAPQQVLLQVGHAHAGDGRGPPL